MVTLFYHISDKEKRFVILLIQKNFEEYYESQPSHVVTLFYHISDNEKRFVRLLIQRYFEEHYE
jgi:hypothetical protein